MKRNLYETICRPIKTQIHCHNFLFLVLYVLGILIVCVLCHNSSVFCVTYRPIPLTLTNITEGNSAFMGRLVHEDFYLISGINPNIHVS